MTESEKIKELQKLIGKLFYLAGSTDRLFQLESITTKNNENVANVYEMTPSGLTGDNLFVPVLEFDKCYSLAE